MAKRPGRREGSGFSTDTATAVEEMLAAALRDDRRDLENQERFLRTEERRGRCGIPPTEIRELVVGVVRQLGLPVATARRAMPGGPGDVEAVLDDGSSIWFEVKAQTKKLLYTDITQSDWVRDATDTLRWLLENDAPFRGRLPRGLRRSLEIPDPGTYFKAWSFRDLWLADVALITSRRDRAAIGLATPADVEAFLGRKYFFHLAQEGARAILLGDLAPIAAALSGDPVTYRLKRNVTSLVSVPVTVGTDERVAHFTYHLYKPEVPGTVKGRHKLHGRSLAEGRFITG